MPETPKNIPNPSLWQRLNLEEFVAIDLETTGLDFGLDSITELGAVRFREGVEVERYSQLVNPGKKLSKEISELTGITNEDLKDAPRLDEVAEEFIEFVGDSDIVGQNFYFDLNFLESARPTSKHFKTARTMPISHDTRIAARFLTPCNDGFGLAKLCERYKVINRSHHRATDDAAATGEVFAILLQHLATIPLPEIADAMRLVAGTASPLANTMRCVHSAISSGYISTKKPPNPLEGLPDNPQNFYSVKGIARPDTPATDQQIVRLFHEMDRFESVMSGYEVRQEQVDMAVQCAGALRDSQLLVVEAGTGVGKSMGYLIPALLTGKRIIVSTHTKNLQDQLFNNEIPRLGALFKFGFNVALLKGRRNYLCRTKWLNWILDPERHGATAYLRESAAIIVRWVNATLTGDLSELSAVYESGTFFQQIASEPGFCTGNSCNGDCPLSNIRKKALKADIVVVNHSLVLSDLTSEGNLLGGDDEMRVIFDEAHHLEEVATDQFGTELSSPLLKNLFDRIGRMCSRKSDLWRSLAADKVLERLVSPLEKIADTIEELRQSANSLFETANVQLRVKIAYNATYTTPFSYKQGDKLHVGLMGAGESLLNGLSATTKALGRTREKIVDEMDEVFPTQVLQEMQAVLNMAGSITEALFHSMNPEDENRVYWVEVPAEMNKPVWIRSAPLEIADMLIDGLWQKLDSALLTSATLATTNTASGFTHILKSLGLNQFPPERVRTSIFGSPFDYANNCLVGYPTFFPSPSDLPADHMTAVSNMCAEIAMRHKTGMLVLFTSYKALRQVERDLKKILLGKDIEILVQRGGRNRDMLIRRLRSANGKAILLGTDSFWEGIDVPGPALQVVVIPKLPFAVPNDPIVAARINKLRREGGNPFMEYQLPNAVLKVRQGAGRLIRTVTDRGVILMLDARILTKRYGDIFYRTLPGKASQFENTESLLEAMDAYISDNTTDE
ncbi:MAG: hypothetical protein HN757_04490 [Calditrichaeota bacterium]|nr:hypothetical protein [Calditrichota bacterium]